MFQNNGFTFVPPSGATPRFPFPAPFMQMPSQFNAPINQQQPMATTSSYSAPPISFPPNPSFFHNPTQSVWPNASMFTRPPPSFGNQPVSNFNSIPQTSGPTSIASAPPIWHNQQFRYPPLPVQETLIPQSALKMCVVLIRDPKQSSLGTLTTDANRTFFRNWMYENLEITMRDVLNFQVVTRANYHAGFFAIRNEQKRQSLLNYSTNGLPVNGVYIRSAESVILETAWAVSMYRNNGQKQAPTDINDAMKALAIVTSPTTEMSPQQFSFLGR
ncbi:hypothetical protein M3Y98_00236600 [Aphelenchoides besseyi]|nr:hypothetical protein M3Y98_00236600 [Aphelenchoides besseyi]KAI6200637.1 hypothetical protein M3Y96_00755000 [Aphelenchoides besseyi]